MRISPTFIGMMIGFALRDTALVKMRLAAWKQVTGMFLSIGSILFILYVQFDWNREGGTPQTISESAAYLTFGRLFFVFGVSGLIVLGTVLGFGDRGSLSRSAFGGFMPGVGLNSVCVRSNSMLSPHVIVSSFFLQYLNTEDTMGGVRLQLSF
jgi:hypothetical protein